MKTIQLTAVGNDPITGKKEQMKFELEADSKENLTNQVVQNLGNMKGMLYMAHIPLYHFNEE